MSERFDFSTVTIRPHSECELRAAPDNRFRARVFKLPAEAADSLWVEYIRIANVSILPEDLGGWAGGCEGRIFAEGQPDIPLDAPFLSPRSTAGLKLVNKSDKPITLTPYFLGAYFE